MSNNIFNIMAINTITLPINAYKDGFSPINIKTHIGFNNASTSEINELLIGVVFLIPLEKKT